MLVVIIQNSYVFNYFFFFLQIFVKLQICPLIKKCIKRDFKAIKIMENVNCFHFVMPTQYLIVSV